MENRENPDFLSADTIKKDKIVNQDGDKIGKFEELMIDLHDGRIAYAVISHGGFLGIGNKLFAIPWQALTLRVHEHAFLFDIPKETLDKAEGFDKDKWPLTYNELSGTYTYYGYQPYWQTGTAAAVAGVSAGMAGESESERMARMEREKQMGMAGETESERMARMERERQIEMPGEVKAERVTWTEAEIREKAEPVAPIGDMESRRGSEFLPANTLKGYKVVNTNGDNLGKIEGLMIDLDSGRVAYAALSFGGFLGMSDKLFAIPWQALSLRMNEQAFTLDIPREVLERAEGFDKDKCPTTREELSRSYSYYGYHPYWETGAMRQSGMPREAEAEAERTTLKERVRQGRLETAEELMAGQEKERIEELEKKETDKEKLAQLERERKIAERREQKYQ